MSTLIKDRKLTAKEKIVQPFTSNGDSSFSMKYFLVRRLTTYNP